MATTDTEAEGPVATWRYAVPNAVTCTSLVFGLIVIACAKEGDFEAAGWWMVWCVLFDKLDGTFARLLGSTSKFGVQLDSLTDLVVFGVAPATTLYFMADTELLAGWAPYRPALYIALATFVVCASLRLAKFNVLADEGPNIFYGMPTTLAGGTLALLLLIGLHHDLSGLLRALPIIAFVFALMMVSNLPLPKVSRRKSKLADAFQATNLTLSYVFGFMRIFPEYLLAVTVTYAGAGFVWGLWHRDDLRGPGDPGSGSGSGPGGGEAQDLEPQPSS